jgi:hypothetical protein
VPQFAAFNTSGLRNASSVSRLPWLGRSVTLLRIDSTGVVEQAKTDSAVGEQRIEKSRLS